MKQRIILDGPPPIEEVSELRVKGAVAIYALLWESSYKDRRWDKRRDLPWEERRDCGGTTHWTIKGLADKLMMGKATVMKALDALLSSGFVQIIRWEQTERGSANRVFRVTQPNQLESVRHAISIMGKPACLTPPNIKETTTN